MPDNHRSKSAKPAHASITITPAGREMNISLAAPSFPEGTPEPPYITLARRLADIAVGHPKTLRHLTDMVRAYMPGMRPADRLELFGKLSKGFCKRCGGTSPCACKGAILVSTVMPDEPEPRS